MLQKLLHDARDDGLLALLPTTTDCQLCVEHTEGHFGSLDYLDGRPVRQSEKQVQLQLQAKLGRLPIDQQVQYWIKILDRLLAGKSTEMSDLVLFPADAAHVALEQIGEPAVMPLLKLIYKWAQYPEWTGDRPQHKFDETPVGKYICPLIWCFGKIGHKSPAVEKQLLRILHRAIETNSSRRLWGTAPVHVARALNELFDYPEAKIHDTNNRLVNADKFLK